MEDIIHVPLNEHLNLEMRENFQVAVLSGLKHANKKIESKYMYDERGCELFNQITRHPDYYLTRCEMEILNCYQAEIAKQIGPEAFNLVELGPGEGIKTKILMDYFLQKRCEFTYMPVDISENYLRSLFVEFIAYSPRLQLKPIHADYINGLSWLSKNSTRRSFVLFLGSSIGNFDHARTNQFLRALWNALQDGDYLLMGFDLRKDIEILMRAYNDSAGITREFNLNLLRRINRELEADFDLEKFYHYATYNVYSGAMESYLVSLTSQAIQIGKHGEQLLFEAFEPIHVEYSYKYLLSQVSSFAENSGFKLIQNFTDAKQYFLDSLWRVVK